MRTPKNYIDNIKNGIITAEMLSDCLYSVNKRAKNCRNKEREYRNSHYDYYIKYHEQKESYYEQKDKMLSIIAPTCIHFETVEKSKRIYDYEDEYDEYYSNQDYYHEGQYYDRDMQDIVKFIDVMVPNRKYYLFYDLGKHSFHTPLYYYDSKQYPLLETVDIGSLITYGNNIADLISTQFVKKVLELIASGNYVLKLGS